MANIVRHMNDAPSGTASDFKEGNLCSGILENATYLVTRQESRLCCKGELVFVNLKTGLSVGSQTKARLFRDDEYIVVRND